MLHILVAYAVGNIFHRHIFRFQQRTGFFQADIFHDVAKSFSRFLPDIFGKVGLGQMHVPYFLQPNLVLGRRN